MKEGSAISVTSDPESGAVPASWRRALLAQFLFASLRILLITCARASSKDRSP